MFLCIWFNNKANGPPPPPLPPPLRACSNEQPIQHHPYHNTVSANANGSHSIDTVNLCHQNSAANSNSNSNSNNIASSTTADPSAVDSDSGLEVIEEPSLKPSELVRGNHNRTMSTISGKHISPYTFTTTFFAMQ